MDRSRAIAAEKRGILTFSGQEYSSSERSELARPISAPDRQRRGRRQTPQAMTSPHSRLASIDTALRDMLSSCPPSERLLALVEELDAERRLRWH